MIKLFFFIVSLCLFKEGSAQSVTYSVAEEKAIRELETKWTSAWNNHDLNAMGELLTDDCDFITVSGKWFKSKKTAVEHHIKMHEMQFKESVWSTRHVHMKYVKPDLAIVHIEWSINGDKAPNGTARQPRDGIFTWVVVKKDDDWKILAVHNVNIRETAPTK